ncbi:hypothetical protein Kpol_1045p55, partial [Vanderwaltozyma polyspora DSM 70294]
LVAKVNASSLDTIEKYIISWFKQSDNPSFLNLSLRIYKIYASSVGLGSNLVLDELAVTRVKTIISQTGVGSSIEWDTVYSALSVLTIISEKSESVYGSDFKGTWDNIIGCLLYPHTWVRLSASRLVNQVVNNLEKFEVKFTDFEIQTIVSRIMHQLSAPSISENLSTVAIKTLVKIVIRWKDHNTKFISKDGDTEEKTPSYSSALDYMVSRASAIIRSEENPNDSFMSKKSSIQLLAMMVQLMNETQLLDESEKIMLPLFIYTEIDQNNRLKDQDKELVDLAQECLKMLEVKMTVSDFTKSYTSVKQTVMKRRRERRTKRSILAVTAPDIAAQRKLKKHARSREKRKHEKDDSGFYQRKNKTRRT